MKAINIWGFRYEAGLDECVKVPHWTCARVAANHAQKTESPNSQLLVNNSLYILGYAMGCARL